MLWHDVGMPSAVCLGDTIMKAITSTMCLAAIMRLVVLRADPAWCDSTNDIEKAYNELVSADDWRKARVASEKLSSYGDAALPFILNGSKHEDGKVREYCYEILYSKFPKHPKSIQAVIEGLDDREQRIRFICAFHLGTNRIAEAKKALKACLEDGSQDDGIRLTVAKSLAELGDRSVMCTLYAGLGSDNGHTRYLSSIGIKALCGKDLTDFGYEGPWEGAFVSAGQEFRVIGQPIEKAKKSLARWEAILAFLKWLEKNRPELFKELDNLG